MKPEQIRQWYGLRSKNGCPGLREHRYPQILRKHRIIIERFVYLRVPNKFFCMACKKLEMFPQKYCPYKLQFKNMENVLAVLAPITYGRTNKIKEFDPEEIIICNCVKDVFTHPEKEDLKKQLQNLYDLTNRYLNDQFKNGMNITLEEFNRKPDYDDLVNKLRWAFDRNVKRLSEEATEEDWKEFGSSHDLIFMISADDVDTYCLQARVYGYYKQFSSPTLFNILNYIIKEKKKTRIIILEGKENNNFIKSLSDRYFKERKVKIDFVDNGIKTKIIDYGSVIHEITNTDSIFCRKTLENFSTQKFIRNTINKILTENHNDPYLKIGVIINKPKKKLIKEEMRLYIPERFKNVTIETRYNSEGLNSFKNCDVGFIVGSPIIDKKNIAYEFFQWNGYLPKNMDTYKKDGRFIFVNPKLDDFREKREEDEAHNEICLFYLNSKKIHLYVFAKVPESINKEGFRIERKNKKEMIEKDRKEWLENFVKEKGRVHAFDADLEFAKRFKLGDKRTYRTVLRLIKESECLTLKRGAIFYT